MQELAVWVFSFDVAILNGQLILVCEVHVGSRGRRKLTMATLCLMVV